MMREAILSFLLVLTVVQNAWACKGDRSTGDDTQVSTNALACCLCGQAITINLIIRNRYQQPFFEHHTEIKDKPQRELLHFLEQAANKDNTFKFTAEYFGSLGYMITKLNGLQASNDDKTYWQMLEDPSGNSLKMGVSSYMPSNGETVIFNFTTWSVSDHV